MPGLDVSPRLARWIESNFEPDSVAPVLAELRGLPEQAVGAQDVERVQASLVIRTGGSWQKFHGMVALVNQDWRDALVAAGLADEDWPSRLDAALGG
jgi:hypothetical protein